MAHSLRKSRLSATLDWGVAALACASAGFLLIAMPDDLFSGLVVRSGLPKLVAAAQPPLGGTARLAAAAAAALFAFAFVLSLLRALERAPAAVAAEADTGADRLEGHTSVTPAEAELPRLRKADAHPDAPARRPILAGRELGEPVPEPEAPVDELLLEPYGSDPLAEIEAEPAALPSFLVPQVEPSEPRVEAFREPEPASRPETAPEAVAPVEAEAEPEPEVELRPEPAPELSALMQRFESGLTRKQQAIVRPLPQPEPVAPAAGGAAGAEAPVDQVGHRLRSAITGLQKVAGQGG